MIVDKFQYSNYYNINSTTFNKLHTEKELKTVHTGIIYIDQVSIFL